MAVKGNLPAGWGCFVSHFQHPELSKKLGALFFFFADSWPNTQPARKGGNWTTFGSCSTCEASMPSMDQEPCAWARAWSKFRGQNLRCKCVKGGGDSGCPPKMLAFLLVSPPRGNNSQRGWGHPRKPRPRWRRAAHGREVRCILVSDSPKRRRT